MKTLINEKAAVALILDSYPGKEEFPLALKPEKTDSEIKVDQEFNTFAELEEEAKGWGDTLFLWIVREAKEGGKVAEYGANPNEDMYTVESILRVFERGRDDLNTVIASFRNL